MSLRGRSAVAASWVLAVCLWLSGGLSFAGSIDTIPTRDKSGIRMQVTQGFNIHPRSGYLPVSVKITNDTGDAHSWSFSFQCPGNNYGESNNRIEFKKSLAVPPNEERIFDFLVPLAPISPSVYSSSNISLQVGGYGVEPAIVSLSSVGGGKTYGGPVCGYSAEIDRTLGTAIREKTDSGNSMLNALIDLNHLPPDWRSLASFDAVWLDESEWAKLAPAARFAIENWVATGGNLFRVSSMTGPEPVSRGFGKIITVSLPIDVDRYFKETYAAIPTTPAQFAQSYRSSWPAASIVPTYKPNSRLLIALIVFFGILVGPINLFVFAKKEKRQRIFWTTPALSLGGALLVGLTILVQDGFNGWGRRLALIYLLPEQNLEVVHQEQASRTGLLTGETFSTEPGTIIQPISLETQPQHYAIEENEHAGQWFASRRVQGQWLSAVRPSRARVQLLNATQIAGGEAPKILSSIGATLEDFFWIDPQGQFWRGSQIGPGKAVSLTPSNSLALESALKLEKLPGPRMAALLQQVPPQPGTFFATSRPPQKTMLPSLSAIIWRNDRAVYLGKVEP